MRSDLLLALLQLIAALGLLAGACLRPAHADDDLPTYDAEPCCTLCPRARDADVYLTQFMRDHRQTLQGQGDWLFRSDIELATQFTIDDHVVVDLARMVRAFKAHGTQILMLDFPPRGVLHADKLLPGDRRGFNDKLALANYRAALQRFRDAGFIVPDYGLLAEHPDGTEYFFHRDGHWTPDGARRTAELIADTVKTLPVYAELHKRAFATKRVGRNRHPGVLSIVASQICGGYYPSEVVLGYTTDPVESDIFGDVPVPEISLVGTSFSATPTYHFAGFLQQNLQTDILNASLSGGNFDGGLTQYLLSDAFQQNPPKLLIWEFGHPQIAVANPGQMRRIVPLVDNGCADKDVLLSNETAVGSGADFTDLLFNGGGQILAVKSRELVVDLKFADPAVSEFLAEAWYLDGKHEVLRVRLNDYTKSGGRFALEMNREPDFAEQPLIDFRVQVVSPLLKPTTVVAKLCRAGMGTRKAP